MIYLRWMWFAFLDLNLMPLWFLLAPIVSLFTARGWPRWGGWLWTYDNPPQGDEGYQKHRAPFTSGYLEPWQLYVNRVFWLWRNPGYGFQKWCGVGYGNGLVVKIIGDGGFGDRISDKAGRAGWYYAEGWNDFGDVVAFELYVVWPWCRSRCVRIRLGWKILTDKFKRLQFAPMVNTANPFKSYGD
jgi:hypothetical protein